MQKLRRHEIPCRCAITTFTITIVLLKGYDCIHTLDLTLKNETPDRIINSISVDEQRILITKDGDFLDSFIVKQEPFKLILVKLGNTSKTELLNFFDDKFDEIIEKIETEQMILLTRD